jgi:hypothetical protein
MTDPRGLSSAGAEVDEQAAASPPTLRDDTDDPLCSLCERRPRVVGCEWCQDCITAPYVGLRRRRAAELRLPPSIRGTS